MGELDKLKEASVENIEIPKSWMDRKGSIREAKMKRKK